MVKYIKQKTYDGAWEDRVEVSINDVGYDVRWPKYNLRGFIWKLFGFKVIISDFREPTQYSGVKRWGEDE